MRCTKWFTWRFWYWAWCFWLKMRYFACYGSSEIKLPANWPPLRYWYPLSQQHHTFTRCFFMLIREACVQCFGASAVITFVYNFPCNTIAGFLASYVVFSKYSLWIIGSAQLWVTSHTLEVLFRFLFCMALGEMVKKLLRVPVTKQCSPFTKRDASFTILHSLLTLPASVYVRARFQR